MAVVDEIAGFVILNRGGGRTARLKYNGSCSKRGFASKAKAKKHLRKKSGLHNGPRNIYKCPHDFCGEWHFTKQPQTE